MDSSYETVVYDSIDESVTEYEENGPNSTSTVTVTLGSDSKPAGNGRRIIPADYEALIGDLTLPNYNASSTPYFLRKKIVPDYQTVCSGLSDESLKYFPSCRRRRRTVNGAVVRNLNAEFEKLEGPSPKLDPGKNLLALPSLTISYNHGLQHNSMGQGQEGNRRISQMSSMDSAYGSQLYMRRKSMQQAPANVAHTEDNKKSQEDSGCSIV